MTLLRSSGRIALPLLLAWLMITSSAGFVSPKIATTLPRTTATTTTTPTTALSSDSTGWDSFRNLPAIRDIEYGEASRKYRRTVYSHKDWEKHRSADRFVYYLAAIFKSGVYRNLAREVSITVAIATIVCVYNGVVGGYTDFFGVEHGAIVKAAWLPKMGLPVAPFTLASPSLGLLLAFRANSSYKRWDEARKNWGMNINHTRDLVRMANAYYDGTESTPQERSQDLHHVALCTWAFVRAMQRHLSPAEEDEEVFKAELYEKLPEQQAAKIVAAAHRPNRALQDLSFAIDNLPMHFIRKHEIHAAATIFEDNLGSSERLLTSPVPLFYSRHTARFVFLWLCLLPFCLYDAFTPSWNHAAMIPATAVISVFLIGIEELATQLEEPFTILPMQAFSDKIYNWCIEIASWAPGDNGIAMKPARPEHAFFTTGPSAGAVYYEQQPMPVAPAQPQYYYDPPAAQQQPLKQSIPANQMSLTEFLKSQGS